MLKVIGIPTADYGSMFFSSIALAVKASNELNGHTDVSEQSAMCLPTLMDVYDARRRHMLENATINRWPIATRTELVLAAESFGKIGVWMVDLVHSSGEQLASHESHGHAYAPPVGRVFDAEAGLAGAFHPQNGRARAQKTWYKRAIRSYELGRLKTLPLEFCDVSLPSLADVMVRVTPDIHLPIVDVLASGQGVRLMMNADTTGSELDVTFQTRNVLACDMPEVTSHIVVPTVLDEPDMVKRAERFSDYLLAHRGEVDFSTVPNSDMPPRVEVVNIDGVWVARDLKTKLWYGKVLEATMAHEGNRDSVMLGYFSGKDVKDQCDVRPVRIASLGQWPSYWECLAQRPAFLLHDQKRSAAA